MFFLYQVTKQGHAVNVHSDYNISSSCSSSPALPHRATGNLAATLKDQSQRLDMTKSSVSLTDYLETSTLSPSRSLILNPRHSSPNYDDSGANLNGLPNNERPSHPTRPRSSYIPLVEADQNSLIGTPQASPKHRSHSRLASSCSPGKASLESRSLYSQALNFSANAVDKVPASNTGSKVSSPLVTRSTEVEVNSPKSNTGGGDKSTVPNGSAASDPSQPRERSVDNSIWYEYGCV